MIYCCLYTFVDPKNKNKEIIETFDLLTYDELKKLFMEMFIDAMTNNKPINFKYNKIILVKEQNNKIIQEERRFIDVLEKFNQFYASVEHFLLKK